MDDVIKLPTDFLSVISFCQGVKMSFCGWSKGEIYQDHYEEGEFVHDSVCWNDLHEC